MYALSFEVVLKYKRMNKFILNNRLYEYRADKENIISLHKNYSD